MGKKSRRSKKTNPFFGFFSFLGKAIQTVLPGFMVAVVIGGVFFGVRNSLYADTFFQVKHIAIQPPLALPMSERLALESRFLGKHLLKVNLSDFSKNLEKNPEIKSISAERKFPSTLALNIEKRIPSAIVKFAAKAKYGVVSEDGMILQLMTELAPQLTLIEAPFIESTELKVGYRIARKGFAEAMQFVRAYQGSSMVGSYPIQKLVFDGQGNVSLFWQNSPEIKLGRRPAERIAALQKITHLLEDKESSKISYIDLQFDNVIVKRKG